ncbi:EAL domain-containing protein [Rhodoferax sp.]|uniref:bifunctional diguanylate cyclase/phosphodiesterase n=1 Tax=Rhodoferax sp. TaxID=50421 RepID=UPI0026310988|nr:EAL domain-containing protein [Rhodoferax sp.]MDD2919170.1 EAL domain-containing protein [Rhodoferax sp.]
MRLSLNLRFIAYLLVLGVLPLLAVSAISIRLTSSAIEDKARYHAVQEVQEMAVLLDIQMAQIEALIANVSGVEEISKVLAEKKADSDAFTRLATQARIGYVLNNFLNLKGLISIDILTLDGRHYHVGDTLDIGNLNTSVRDQLIKETLTQAESVYWAGVRPNVNGNSTHRLTLVAAHAIVLRNPVTSRREPVALLLVNFDPNQVHQQFGEIVPHDENMVVVLDGSNRFVYHPDAGLIGQAAGTDMLATLAEIPKGPQSRFTDSGVLVTSTSMRASGWRVASLVSQASLTRSARDISRATALVMLVSLILVVLGALSLLRQVVRPLRAISKRFRLLREAPQTIQTPLSVRGKDEIADLTIWFNAYLDNLSARRQSEEKLQLAASVFSNAREGIMITNTKGTIIDVNQAFTRITGYSREEVLGHSPSILSSGRHDKAFYDSMWLALIKQGHWTGEIWNRHKDGEVFAELLAVSSVRDDKGVVKRYLGLFSDITSIKQYQIELEHTAHYDALTNLPNRLLMADRLQQAMAQVQRRQKKLAVLFLDLDGFKDVNDGHGHVAGDHVLITLAQRMKQAMREGDSIARIGGDEFVAILIDLNDIADSLPLLERLLAAVAQPVEFGDITLEVSASVGVTLYPQAHDISADQLVRQADQAMYQAKVAGKNRYHIFDVSLDDTIRSHHESVERIRLALEQREFVLYYQPKVNMRTGEIIGAEALIRWQHPDRGLLTPAGFLPVIEGHALAISVGEWVIDTALTQIEIWHSAGLDKVVSVNIGAHQLQQGDFVDRLRLLLAKHPQVKSKDLELEVLETSAMEDIAKVSQVIEACAQIGVKFALDDFGTGYSSLTYLKRLRVALLKIDQSFVRDMLNDPDDLAILQGIIGLAAAFKCEVIAEGVETVAHGTALLQLGCELAQGYGIARPMPPDQLPAWAATWQPDAAWGGMINSGAASRSADK